MNVWSAPTVTIANKVRGLALVCSALGLFQASGALAQDSTSSAPALLGVQEMLVQHARLGNSAASDSCGLLSSDAANEILKVLRSDQLNAFSAMEAPPVKMGVARIELIPEIVSMQRQGIDCTSWVAFSAQSKTNVRVPPVQLPRNVTITYWRGGLMVSSPQISHPRAVKDAVAKLATQFSKEYRRAQPPPLPDLGE